MTHVNLPANLSVGDTLIHQKNGLYSLNDLHQASGGGEKHQPASLLSQRSCSISMQFIEIH